MITVDTTYLISFQQTDDRVRVKITIFQLSGTMDLSEL
jgi:hypothetical protein